jgi:arsenate reductase-like glutaredoxin family protein
MRIETTALQTLQVFTHPRCPHSRDLVDDFRRRGVTFVERNLAEDGKALEDLMAVCWEHRLPVVVDHERVSIGFRGRASTFGELGLD